VNIILIGFKSAGKTTVGKKLAAKLGRSFIDVDDKIAGIYQRSHGGRMTARQIYIKQGDAGYRVLEKEAILTLGTIENAIIATGGGSVCDPENAKVLGRDGKFVYLDAPKEIIQKRIGEDASLSFLDLKHPARNFEQTFAGRQKIYKETADLIINTKNKTIEDVIKVIEESFYGK
jgi:shikimate kinase